MRDTSMTPKIVSRITCRPRQASTRHISSSTLIIGNWIGIIPVRIVITYIAANTGMTPISANAAISRTRTKRGNMYICRNRRVMAYSP